MDWGIKGRESRGEKDESVINAFQAQKKDQVCERASNTRRELCG